MQGDRDGGGQMYSSSTRPRTSERGQLVVRDANHLFAEGTGHRIEGTDSQQHMTA